MTARTPRTRTDVHPTWHHVVVGGTWTLLGVLGCLASVWISTLSTSYFLRTMMVVVLVMLAYAVWFRVGRALGFIDRGVLSSLQQMVDGMSPS